MVEKIKQIKIDEDLFRMIYQYFIYGHKDETELIKAGLKDKMDKMILRVCAWICVTICTMKSMLVT